MMRALTWMPAVCAAAFPLHPRATTPVLALWILLLLWVEIADQTKRRLVPVLPAIWWAGLAYYMLIAIGLLWSENMEAGLFALEVKLSLLVLPILFFRTERHVKWKSHQLIDALCVGLLLSGAIGLVQAGWFSLFEGNHRGWSYAELAGPLHPTYLAWYWAFAWFAWLTKKRNPMAWWGGSLLAGLMIGLLASKAGWIAGGLVVVWNLLKRDRRAVTGIGAFGLLLGAALFGQGRLDEMVEGFSKPERNTKVTSTRGAPEQIGGSTVGRLQAWEAASAVMARHPFGVGTGDVESQLARKYEDIGAKYAAKHGMNAHNAYLQAGVAFGWVGLLLLVIWWGVVAWTALRRHQELAMAFSALALWFACTESVLELQSGVVWIAFGCWAWGVREMRSKD